MPDLSPCLINPKKSRSEPGINPLALLIPIPGDLQRMSRFFGETGSLFFKNNALRVFQLFDSRRAIGLGGPAVGAPQAIMILEKLIALGARRVIFLGWTGGLNPSLSPGDLILPDKAISEEGTSRHYSDEICSGPSFPLLRDIQKALKAEGLSFKQGPVWTTDAPYRETLDKVKTFQAQGVLGVDMEISAFFTVSAFRGIEAAALLIVSDDLSGLTWRHGFRETRFLEARRQVARFLFQFAVRTFV
ncbi:MAG: nucleoside phosphorylase [Deltaproteobacteria bacterium]|nr:nucleoside phosphorylase [Deltaproteobacteria bacterium]